MGQSPNRFGTFAAGVSMWTDAAPRAQLIDGKAQ
jgi:hypothetical protein